MDNVLFSALAFLLAIGVLVAVHEWGHYIVARMAGVKVLRYSVGFGKPIWMTRRGPDNTEYCVSAIPLGGYVKLLDEREGEVPVAESHRTFNSQSVFARVAILLAGPVMNLVFAVAAYWLMFVVGVPGDQPLIGAVEPDSIAAEAGLQDGDLLVQVGDDVVETWDGGVLALIDQLLVADEIMVIVERDGVKVTTALDVAGQLSELTKPGQLFVGLGMKPWSPELPPVVGELLPGQPALEAGVQVGDELLALDGEQITGWMALVDMVQARPGQTVPLDLQRNGSRMRLELSIDSFTDAQGGESGRIGVGPLIPDGYFEQYRAEQRYAPVKAFSVAVERTWEMTVMTVRMVVRMFVGDVSVKNISGPINIAQYAGYSASIGLASFLSFLAVVSLSLGILNLLPIPVLDGGQIVYQLAEAAKGSPLSEKAQLVGQQIGVVFLVLLMGVAFYNDLTRLLS